MRAAKVHDVRAETCTDAATHALVVSMMTDVREIAECLGVRFRHAMDKRIEGARAVGAHKTSMFQGLEEGEPLELDEITGVPTTTLRAVYACAALLDRKRRGCDAMRGHAATR